MPRPEVPAAARLIVALDVIEESEAKKLVDGLDGVISFYKINTMLIFTSWGMKFIGETLLGKSLFVDLKLGDIGATIRGSVEQITNLNKGGPGCVKFLTLGPAAGADTYRAATQGRGPGTPEILAIPVLSSIDEDDFRQMLGRQFERKDLLRYVDSRAEAALASGCDGLIASGELIGRFREKFPDATIVSPGIRLSDSPTDDHKRTATPEEAIRSGADYLVVGRPITQSPEPADVAREIIERIEKALDSPELPAQQRSGGLSTLQTSPALGCKPSGR